MADRRWVDRSDRSPAGRLPRPERSRAPADVEVGAATSSSRVSWRSSGSVGQLSVVRTVAAAPRRRRGAAGSPVANGPGPRPHGDYPTCSAPSSASTCTEARWPRSTARPSSRRLQLSRNARLLLLTEGVNDHENLGALFRNAAAFGVDGVLLDPTTADPLYRRSVRVSMGHVLDVPFASDRRPTRGLALRSIGRRHRSRVDASTAAPDLRMVDPMQLGHPVVVAVGAEGPGLTAVALWPPPTCIAGSRWPTASTR